MWNYTTTLFLILMFKDSEYLDILASLTNKFQNHGVTYIIAYYYVCWVNYFSLVLTKKRNTGNIKCDLHPKRRPNEHCNSLSRGI